MASIKSYKELNSWKKGMEMVTEIYKVTKLFPKSEQYGLTSQIRRAAVSVPSNIAEGFQRYSIKENIRFHKIAIASGAEVETQLLIAQNLGFVTNEDIDYVEKILNGVMKLLNKSIQKLKQYSK